MTGNLKYLFFFVILLTLLNNSYAGSFHAFQSWVQHHTTNHNPIAEDQLSFAMEDTSHEECMRQASIRTLQPVEQNTEMIRFIMAPLPEKPTFPFRRPPKIS